MDEARDEARTALQRAGEEHEKLMSEMDRQVAIAEELRQEAATWANKFAHLERGHQNHVEEIRKQCDLEKRSLLDVEISKLH
jgi:hypothetical protein